MRDEVVEHDLAAHHAIDEHRDGVARLPATEGRAAALAPRDELEGPRADLLTW